LSGDFATPPPDAIPTLDDEASSTSSEGLVEIPSPVANGGFMIRLEGRFMNSMTGSRDVHGKVTGVCEDPHTTASPVRGKE